MDEKVPRRYVLQRTASLGFVAALGAIACGKERRALSCTDTSALAPIDAQMRATLAYVDISTEPGKTCSGCQQYIPAPSPDICGTCKVVKGPINPNGNCKSFVAKIG
jgi:hypothetical protein